MGTVLLVEDEWLVALSQAEALADAGFGVHTALDGASALVAADALELIAAIVDMGLPDRSGADVARELRARDPTLPILVCTGYDAHALNELMCDTGVCIVEKPIDGIALIAALREHIRSGTRFDASPARTHP